MAEKKDLGRQFVNTPCHAITINPLLTYWKPAPWATNSLDHEPSGGSQRTKGEEPICRGAINEGEVAFASLVKRPSKHKAKT